MTKSEQRFYQKLGQQVDIECDRILNAKLSLVTEHKQDPAKWCQNIMLEECIPQEKAAGFLKSKLGLDIVLLPAPEITVSIG